MISVWIDMCGKLLADYLMAVGGLLINFLGGLGVARKPYLKQTLRLITFFCVHMFQNMYSDVMYLHKRR